MQPGQPGQPGYLNLVLPFLGCRCLQRKPEEESGGNTDLTQLPVQGIVALSLLLNSSFGIGKKQLLLCTIEKCKVLQSRLVFWLQV